MGRISSSVFFGLAALGGVSLSSASNAAEAEPVKLYPSGYWNLDFAQEKCRLARVFGEGDDRHIVVFEQGGPDKKFGFTVAGPRLKDFERGRSISIGFGGFAPSNLRQPFIGDNDVFGSALIYSGLDFENVEEEVQDGDEVRTTLPSIDAVKAGQIEYIAVSKGKKHRLEFWTGSLGPAIDSLNGCSQDLIKDWGLDLERHLAMTRMPVWLNQAKVVQQIQRHYPSRARRSGEQAIIRMRVNVDEAGNVTDCVLNDATQTERLESPACRAMRDAKFAAALDADGKAMPSYYKTNIVYRMNAR